MLGIPAPEQGADGRIRVSMNKLCGEMVEPTTDLPAARSRRARFRTAWRAVVSGVAVVLAAGCAAEATRGPPPNAIVIGAALPFSGPLSTTGVQLERALRLAIEDVNAAGGVNGRPLYLKVRDTNSGSERGLNALLDLLYEDQVAYLVGPEEDHLALEVVRDIKDLDVVHLLPGYASPAITDSGGRGAWVRLATSPRALGCGLATAAFEDGARTARIIATRDDFHLELATLFGSTFVNLGGRTLPTVTVQAGELSYARAVSQVERYDADVTVLLTYPGTAASIITEMDRGQNSKWYFSPMLRDEAFLWNVAPELVEDSVGASPSLTENEDCRSTGDAGRYSCTYSRTDTFQEHFAERWDGAAPLPAAHFYYDSVLLLALALEAAAAQGIDNPRPRQILPYFTATTRAAGEPASWSELEQALQLAAGDDGMHFIGAAGEYDFNERGQNLRSMVTTWIVNEERFTETQSVSCDLKSGAF